MRLLALAALVALFAFPVMAQTSQCYPSEVVELQLAAKYGERVTESREVESGGHVVLLRFWLSDAAKTWTITGTNDGVTCILAHGKNHTNEDLDGFVKAALGGETDV